MKTFEKFFDQIEKTRCRSLVGPERGQVSSVLPKPSVIAAPVSKGVIPKQMGYYLKENDLAIDQFINDKLLRERVIKGDDTLDANYLDKGAVASKSVCRINIISGEGEEGFGTGFLIAPDVMITNNHVLPDITYAGSSYVEFNYEKGSNDLPLPVKVFQLNPARLFFTNEELDYTIVCVENEAADNLGKLAEFGYLKLNPNLGKTKEGNYVSIIQHPDGKMKKVALRENQITNLSMPKFIRYVTDTKSGSSGAPVFNDKWEVVAVHHAGIPKYNAEGKILNLAGEVWDKSQGELQVDWVENEGVRISSIVYDITTTAVIKFPFLSGYFKPVSDMNMIGTSMGIVSGDLEKDVYFQEEKDATDRARYYKNIPEVGSAGYDDWHKLLESTHISHHNYSPSKYVYPKVDLHPDGLLRSIYSGKEFTAQELILADKKIDIERELEFITLAKQETMLGQEAYNEQIEALEDALPYNCEHVVCQSWFNKQEPMRGDLHHLFACESRCNSFRNNHPYFEFPGYTPQPAAIIEKERTECGNMENDKFEPENNKGIVARAVLYFLVRYPKAIKIYQQTDIQTLKDWAAGQPVTLYEKHRNREIYLSQGNRNPFIDFPELITQLNLDAAI
jgi:endonuclease G